MEALLRAQRRAIAGCLLYAWSRAAVAGPGVCHFYDRSYNLS